MTAMLRRFSFLIAPALLVACISSHDPPTEPTLDVEAAIAAVTLGDDCVPAASAPPAEDDEGRFIAADCGEEGPCGFCQQTGMNLSLEAGVEGDAVPFEVVEIRVYDMETGALADTLDAHAAQIFRADAYEAWDQTIAPGDVLSVRYDSTAPDWAAIGGGDSWSTHGMSFRVEMDVLIDGVPRTLDFSPASREAEIVT
ncbi:MAG: hypothetical protein AB8I08_00690 [Sandaracinaceae bacterium]